MAQCRHIWIPVGNEKNGYLSILPQACVNGLPVGGFYSLMGMGRNAIFGVMKTVTIRAARLKGGGASFQAYRQRRVS